MPNYGKGKIYTIRCKTDDTLIYVGSTIQSLAVRWGGHKKNSKREPYINSLIYKTVNGKWENWYIELYELYPCSCKEELSRKEGEIIRLIGNLNMNIAGRTDKEYREDNKEKIKEYREVHKEKIAERKKIYYEDHKEYITVYKKAYSETHKEEKAEYDKKYREDNKEKKSKNDKAYYEANKEKKAEYDKIYRLRKKQDENKNNSL